MTTLENQQKASILNSIENEQEYKKTYPSMVGDKDSIGATQEAHIFLAELNPSPERVEEYYALVEEWNKLHPGLTYQMKPCYLALVFRDAAGGENTVAVMQSSRYIRSDDTDYVIQQTHEDAAWFVRHGFSVIREKIEAQAHGIVGIPLTDEEMAKYPEKYFEFHIKIGRVDKEDTNEMTEAEIDELKKISDEFTREFQVPVPLSYNLNKDQNTGDGMGHQRFLNVRFRGIGLNTIMHKIEAIHKAINGTGRFKVLKTISEYVWYDTFTQLDHGWVDYTPEELAGLMKSLNEQKSA